MSVAPRALLGCDFALAPVNVVTAVMAISASLRVAVGRHDAATRDFESIDDYETAGRNNFTVDIKRHWPLRSQGEFGDFVPAHKNLPLFARHGFERGSIDHLFDALDLAVDFLRGKFQLVELSFSERGATEPEQAGL